MDKLTDNINTLGLVVGRRIEDGVEVFVNGNYLGPDFSQSIYNHSPDGFEWGYAGSGPAQFALALLLHFTDDIEFSKRNYQKFKHDVVSKLPKNFTISMDLISRWIIDQGGSVSGQFTKNNGRSS